MANKIDSVVDAIETKLNELVAAKTLKAVKRAVINPFTENNPPVVGLVVSRARREDAVWIADLLVMLVASKGSVTPDERVTELVGELDGKITALRDAGTAGGFIDDPIWDYWYDASSADGPLMHVGAIGGLRIRIEPPLKTA